MIQNVLWKSTQIIQLFEQSSSDEANILTKEKYRMNGSLFDKTFET